MKCIAAIGFWARAATDTRIGAAFRHTCRANENRLREAADRL